MTRTRHLAALPLLPVMAALVGCAASTGGTYPSLAPRPIEKTSFAEPVARPASAAVSDPVLDRTLAATAAQVDTVAKGFAADAAKAEAAARLAKGKLAGSDHWLDAQTALGTLDGWHSQLSTLATDLEQQAIARAETLAPPYPPLEALNARIDAENASEAATIARVQGMLAPA